jgi:hypothetical protein
MTVLSDNDTIPEPLRGFIARGGSVFRGDEDDWEVSIETPVPRYLEGVLPRHALIIANNGCGDLLFLEGTESKYFGDRVFVYWHEGATIEPFADHLRDLTDPSDPVPSSHGPVFYADSKTPVMIGDHVSARDMLFRKQGRVVYVPGVSRKNRELEHGGLTWVAIRFQGGGITGTLVDPDSGCLRKSIRFLSRAMSEVEEIGPYEDLDG